MRALLLLVPSLLCAAEGTPLTLKEALALAVAATPVQIADLGERRAEEEAVALRVRALYPNLSATGSAARGTRAMTISGQTDATPPATDLDARLRITQPLIDLHSYHTWRAALAGRSVARADRRLVTEQVCAATAAAYVDLVRTRAQVTDRTQDLTLAEELLTLAKAKVAAGTAPALDATRAEAQVAARRTALVAATGAAEQASITLARHLDADTTMPLVPADTLDRVALTDAPTDPTQALTVAQNGRPDALASVAALAVAEQQRKAARGARLPTVGAFADGGYNGPRTDDMAQTWGIGLQVTIPLFDSGSWTQEAAEIGSRQAALRQRDTTRRIAAEVRSALVGLTSATAGLSAAQEQDRLSRAELAQARDRFTAGVAGNLEVINAQLAASAATSILTDAQAALAQARVGLATATGQAADLR